MADIYGATLKNNLVINFKKINKKRKCLASEISLIISSKLALSIFID